MSQSFAGQNLKYLRKLKGLTQEEFAQKLQIKRSLLGAYEEERAEPRVDVLEVVSDLFRVSLDDLLRRDMSESKGNYLSKRRQLKMSGENQVIHFVPMKAAAGYLAGYADDEFIDELNTFTLPMLGSGHFRAFEIIGDSMLPTPSGSIIVGQKWTHWMMSSKMQHALLSVKMRGLFTSVFQGLSNQKIKSRSPVTIHPSSHTRSMRKIFLKYGRLRWLFQKWRNNSVGMWVSLLNLSAISKSRSAPSRSA